MADLDDYTRQTIPSDQLPGWLATGERFSANGYEWVVHSGGEEGVEAFPILQVQVDSQPEERAAWYAGLVGQTFEVVWEKRYDRFTLAENIGRGGAQHHLNPDDCKIIDD